MRHVVKPKPIKMTAARAAVIRRDWHDLSVSGDELLARVNALPGEPIARRSSLYSMARVQLRLPSSRRAGANGE